MGFGVVSCPERVSRIIRPQWTYVRGRQPFCLFTSISMASRCTRMNNCDNPVQIEFSTSRGLFEKRPGKGKMGFPRGVLSKESMRDDWSSVNIRLTAKNILPFDGQSFDQPVQREPSNDMTFNLLVWLCNQLAKRTNYFGVCRLAREGTRDSSLSVDVCPIIRIILRCEGASFDQPIHWQSSEDIPPDLLLSFFANRPKGKMNVRVANRPQRASDIHASYWAYICLSRVVASSVTILCAGILT